MLCTIISYAIQNIDEKKRQKAQKHREYQPKWLRWNMAQGIKISLVSENPDTAVKIGFSSEIHRNQDPWYQ